MEKRVTEREAELTWDHIAHSPVGSIEKAKRLALYSPLQFAAGGTESSEILL